MRKKGEKKGKGEEVDIRIRLLLCEESYFSAIIPTDD